MDDWTVHVVVEYDVLVFIIIIIFIIMLLCFLEYAYYDSLWPSTEKVASHE